MAINVNVPLATNVLATDLAAINANWEYVVKSDGTAGRVLRCLRLNVAYNATEDSVQVYTTSVWNGNAIESSGTPYVISKGDSDAVWELDSNGIALTIKATGISGNAVAAMAVVTYNKSGETNIYVFPSANGYIGLTFFSGSAGVGYDISGLASGESFEVDIIYITSA